jgi:hypothetical protein
MNETWSLPADRRIPNTQGAFLCTQAALIMGWALLSGEELRMADAQLITGYHPGKETWPYRMLAWLAEQGCEVVHFDAIDADALAADPRGELERNGFDEETIAYFFKITDFEAEAEAVARCHATGRLKFVNRKPEMDDLRDGLSRKELPILSLDLGTLQGKREGFQGHVLLATGYDDEGGLVRLQDPGPPDHWDWDVEKSIVQAALRYPTETSGTVTLVRKL